MSQNQNKPTELSKDEQKSVNGGSFLGNDNSSLTGITQGYVNTSHTDEDGQTESYNSNFGSGSLLQGNND